MNMSKCFDFRLPRPLIALAILLVMGSSTNAQSCLDAVKAIIPCRSYLIGAGGNDPSAECCSSAQVLNKMTDTMLSRRNLCKCFKSSGASSGVLPALATHFALVCNINLDDPPLISANIDCDSIPASYNCEETPLVGTWIQ